MRILYVHATLEPPSTDPRRDRFQLLSGDLEGEVLHPIWFETPSAVEAVFGPGSYPIYTAGRFRYHWILSSGKRGPRQRLETFWRYLRTGLRLHREQPFDCIVAYSHMTTGLIAGVLKVITGCRLVIEIATSPHLVYITERPDPGFRERLMKTYSDVCLHLSVLLANRMHLLFAGALAAYPLLRKAPSSVFHEFVPVSLIDRAPANEEREQYVLIVGMPWYLKGVDVMIEAFQSLAAEFPEVKLKILGHFPDREKLDALIAGSTQIEVLKAIPNPQALEIIRRATVVVLASRCEGMGRVLLEGMAAAVPLAGSDVGGIPTMVFDGDNGFLFPVGDSMALAGRLRQLLHDPELRRRLGDRGFERAHTELNEQVYVREFRGMIQAAVQSGKV